MSEHLRYPHLERFGTPEVEGIEIGTCLVFPKLDGTNASIWLGSDRIIYGGSRNRALFPGSDDNQGFRAWIESADAPEFRELLEGFPHWRLFGEWLVPHTFKHYREEAWRRFWIFDVWDAAGQRWVPYEEYAGTLAAVALDVIEPIARVINPTQGQLIKIAEGNTYLVQDGAGPGEGIVLKRYDFVNRFGNTTWAKLVRNEFKEENRKAFGVVEAGEVFQVEVAIAQEFVTATLVAKERAKIEAVYYAGISPENCDGLMQADMPRSSLIPRLLETVFHCVVTEELWPALKKYKDPTIDFKKLRRHVIAQTKSLAKDLF